MFVIWFVRRERVLVDVCFCSGLAHGFGYFTIQGPSNMEASTGLPATCSNTVQLWLRCQAGCVPSVLSFAGIGMPLEESRRGMPEQHILRGGQ